MTCVIHPGYVLNQPSSDHERPKNDKNIILQKLYVNLTLTVYQIKYLHAVHINTSMIYKRNNLVLFRIY